MNNNIAYAIACVVVPMVWGLGVMFLSNWFERRLKTRADRRQEDAP